MAVGRLVGLASQTTLPTSSSASVTVPNDGSVTAGDLLVVGCVMPSGSRTFAITGGAGTWTSLGTASQSGHMSQLWWRTAEAGDLGATITVTPSTGNIRQVLLLGKVTGAHPSSPIAGSQGATTTSTVKTTPTLGSIPAGCREISAVWDSRGNTSPNTSTWTAPAGQTRQIQAFTTAGSGSCSGAMGDSDTTVSGAVGARDWTPDQAAIGSSWTVAVAPVATEQALNPSRIDPTAALYGPTPVPGTVSITPGRVEAPAVIHGPLLAPGAATVAPQFLTPAAAVHQPTLTPDTATLQPARIAPTVVVHAPTITGGAEPVDDLDITVGQPYTTWTTGQPHSTWEVGQPWA